jgi:hypothetical protein
VWLPVLSRVCVRPCGCVWFVCVVVLYCYVVGSYPVFLLNGMKRSSPAFFEEKKEILHFIHVTLYIY